MIFEAEAPNIPTSIIQQCHTLKRCKNLGGYRAVFYT
jgi:hypothetical protein